MARSLWTVVLDATCRRRGDNAPFSWLVPDRGTERGLRCGDAGRLRRGQGKRRAPRQVSSACSSASDGSGLATAGMFFHRPAATRGGLVRLRRATPVRRRRDVGEAGREPSSCPVRRRSAIRTDCPRTTPSAPPAIGLEGTALGGSRDDSGRRRSLPWSEQFIDLHTRPQGTYSRGRAPRRDGAEGARPPRAATSRAALGDSRAHGQGRGFSRSAPGRAGYTPCSQIRRARPGGARSWVQTWLELLERAKGG